MAYFYRAYGLSLHSDVPIPGLPRLYSEFCDLELTLNSEPNWVRSACGLPENHPVRPSHPRHHDSDFRLSSFGTEGFLQLAYGDGTRFVLDPSAGRLWGTCPAWLTIEDTATYLLGPVLGFILRYRGIISLHASAFCVNGRAVMLTGESQAGKSTTVAALALAGFPVLAEDIAAIQSERDGFRVQPGYPRICLWPDAVKALLGSADALPRITPTWEKRFLALDGTRAQFEAQPRPLGAIYVFAPRESRAAAPRIEALDKRDALMELVQNTYMNWLLNRAQRAAELDVLARIVDQVPVHRVTPHSDPAMLPALRDAIARDSADLLPAPKSFAHSA